MPEEVRYEDLPIIFQSDGTITDEIDEAEWHAIWLSHLVRRSMQYVRVGDTT